MIHPDEMSAAKRRQVFLTTAARVAETRAQYARTKTERDNEATKARVYKAELATLEEEN